MVKLFGLLNANRNNEFITKSDEYRFYQENKKILLSVPEFEKYFTVTDDFSYIQANIIIKTLQNKLAIEDAVKNAGKNIKEVVDITVKDLPYIDLDNNKIYVPLYVQTNNKIYYETPEKLLTYPYSDLVTEISDSLIDMFEEYNFALYESNFTSLVYLAKDINTRAYLHLDFLTIYIINDQGRCDLKIPLFDKYIKRPEINHLLDRTIELVNAYYESDRDKFVDILIKQKFMSSKLAHRYFRRRKK